MVAPSGEQYPIAGGGYRAVVTECGAGLRTLEYDGRPLVEGYGDEVHADAGRGQLLAPWPNRLRDGRYTVDGQQHQLALSEPARHNASHGLVRWAAWRLQDHTESAVTLTHRLMAQKGYPWTVDLEARYELSAAGLTVTVTARNRAASRAPYALGAHPYLTVGDDGVDGWRLTLPAATRLLTDDRKLPCGREPVDGGDHDFRTTRAVGGTVLDDAFTDLTAGPDGRVAVRLEHPRSGAAVSLWMDDRHRWVQVYTGDDLPAPRRSIAVEPMTSPPDAFNSGDDLVVLEPVGSPGDTHTCSWGVTAG